MFILQKKLPNSQRADCIYFGRKSYLLLLKQMQEKFYAKKRSKKGELVKEKNKK